MKCVNDILNDTVVMRCESKEDTQTESFFFIKSGFIYLKPLLYFISE